jgi:hypothetical protein
MSEDVHHVAAGIAHEEAAYAPGTVPEQVQLGGQGDLLGHQTSMENVTRTHHDRHVRSPAVRVTRM